MPEVNQPQQNENPKKQKLIILACALLLFTVIGYLVASKIGTQQSQPQQADQNHATTYSGMGSFIDRGLSTTQVNNLTKAFSLFAPNSKEIVVNKDSLVPGPYNPNSTDPSFAINFLASIDGKPYRGTVKYSGLGAVQLLLYDSDGKQVYDSKVIDSGE